MNVHNNGEKVLKLPEGEIMQRNSEVARVALSASEYELDKGDKSVLDLVTNFLLLSLIAFYL